MVELDIQTRDNDKRTDEDIATSEHALFHRTASLGKDAAKVRVANVWVTLVR